jgi:hypothetical protein
MKNEIFDMAEILNYFSGGKTAEAHMDGARLSAG